MLSAKHKKRLKLLFIKVPIALVLLCLLMIGALKLVERYPDPLKEGFEKYLSERTNTSTTIGNLEKVTFYPDIDIRLENLTMHRNSNTAIIDMEAEKIYISVPLSGFFIKQGRVNFIEIKNVKAEEKIFTPYGLVLHSAKIIDKEGPEQYGSFLIADGIYGGKEFNFEAEIQKDRKSYKIPDSLSFSLALGGYELNATTQKKALTVSLKNLTFQKGNQTADAKDYVFVEKGNYTTDNPLACLYLHAGDDLKKCDEYLK